MESKDILLVGFYYYPFGATVSILTKDGELFPVEWTEIHDRLEDDFIHDIISGDEFDAISDYYDGVISFDDNIDNYNAKVKFVNNLLSYYKQVIVCEDGRYDLLKKRYEEKNYEESL